MAFSGNMVSHSLFHSFAYLVLILSRSEIGKLELHATTAIALSKKEMLKRPGANSKRGWQKCI